MALENPQNHLFFKIKQGGVSHHGLAIKKNYENSNIIFQKKSSKRNQNPSRYYNSCN
jgi:hypothetical protein